MEFNNNTLANVMDLLLDAICMVDVEGRYVYVSAAFERIFGYAPAEVIGRPMIELVHPDDRARTLQAAGNREEQQGRCGEYTEIEMDRAAEFQKAMAQGHEERCARKEPRTLPE